MWESDPSSSSAGGPREFVTLSIDGAKSTTVPVARDNVKERAAINIMRLEMVASIENWSCLLNSMLRPYAEKSKRAVIELQVPLTSPRICSGIVS